MTETQDELDIKHAQKKAFRNRIRREEETEERLRFMDPREIVEEIHGFEDERDKHDKALLEIIGHLGTALIQSIPSDDQIIIGHIRSANKLAVAARKGGY